MTMLETGRRVGVSSAVLGALALSFAAQAAPVDCAGGGQCVVSDVDGSINVVANSPAITTDGFGFNVKNAGGLSWNVNGTNILFSQSSFYRVNGAGQESPVGGLLWSTATEDSTEKQIRIRTEDGGQGIVVDTLYTLQPASPGRTSQVLKDVQITNTSGSAMSLNWIEFFDFDLSGVAVEDDDSLTSVLHAGTRVITQGNSRIGRSVTSQWTMVTADGTFVFDQPVGYQLSAWRSNPNSGTPSLLESLFDGGVTNLGSTPDSLSGRNDYQYGVQFAFNDLAAGASVSFRNTMTAVPEPSSIALAVLALGLMRRRSRKA